MIPVQNIARVEYEVKATMARKPYTLHESWEDLAAIEFMSEWIERFVPADERLSFCYGER